MNKVDLEEAKRFADSLCTNQFTAYKGDRPVDWIYALISEVESLREFVVKEKTAIIKPSKEEYLPPLDFPLTGSQEFLNKIFHCARNLDKLLFLGPAHFSTKDIEIECEDIHNLLNRLLNDYQGEETQYKTSLRQPEDNNQDIFQGGTRS